ncbi:MAG: anthranilate synthase component I [Dethiobacter sp.]|jgi:anthranilate synthase component 1|nr:anthranilate synthase component I [Dethiobacter sp.]
MNLTAMSKGENLVTLHRTLVGDIETPISAFFKLCPSGPAFLLESAAGGEQVARYSILGYNPFLTLKSRGEEVELCWQGGPAEKKGGGPLAVLRSLMADYHRANKSLPRFSGGAVGYFSYDNVALLEPVGSIPGGGLGLPDVYLQFMRNVVVFDHFTHRIHLVVNHPVRQQVNPAVTECEAACLMQQMVEGLARPLTEIPDCGVVRKKIKPAGNMSEAEFVEKVKTAKEYIKNGDAFQIVLSQRFTVPLDEDPFIIYRRLRSLNPSPYMFFLRNEELALVGASPEMLARLEDGIITTRPIAGTRRRGGSLEDDQAMEAELLSDEKERAEHVMLVDLGRNDIGRVSRYGTVKVSEFAKVERFSHVMHLVSEVCGELQEGKDALDALVACFPAGTLSGAPKVRAMQIINELEPVARGPYGGAVGYFDFTGNMDTCITIRTVVIKDGSAYIQTGAGIVADSVPESEYRETLQKAGAMFATLGVEEK